MEAQELIEFLQSVPKKSKIVVNGKTVSAACTLRGRLSRDYFGESFYETEKGREIVVVFLEHTEFSDGHVGLVVI